MKSFGVHGRLQNVTIFELKSIKNYQSPLRIDLLLLLVLSIPPGNLEIMCSVNRATPTRAQIPAV